MASISIFPWLVHHINHVRFFIASDITRRLQFFLKKTTSPGNENIIVGREQLVGACAKHYNYYYF